MTRSLILGANGQDGSLLAERLLRLDHEVLGLGRQAVARYPIADPKYRYQRVDLRDAEATRQAAEDFQPHRIFHLAAVHGAAGFAYEEVWQDVMAVNLGALHILLEFARQSRGRPSIVYASSAKVFGSPLTGHISETSARTSNCLYSITKNAAEELIHHYRANHQVKASLAFLFNHESERRLPRYFVPTVLAGLAGSLADPSHQITVNTLDFYCDWGCAAEYMELIAEIAERAAGEDFIIATGKVSYGRDFVAKLFADHGLDHKRHVEEKHFHAEPAPCQFSASTEKLEKVLGKAPTRDIFDVSAQMLRSGYGIEPIHQGERERSN